MSINTAQPLNSLGPWPLGLNNVHSDYDLPAGALRDAVNVDLTLSGHARRRKGKTLRYSGEARSLWPRDQAADTLYGVTSAGLVYFTRAVSGTLTPTTIRSGVPISRPLAYLDYRSPLDRNRVYYSNGLVTGMIVNRVHYPWGVERPSGQPACAAAASGGLNAGTYQVAVTFLSTFSEESGTGECARVDVAAGGGITLSAIPQPADNSVTRVRLYCSDANGEIPYLHTILPVGTTGAVLARTLSPGHALQTQFIRPPPPGDVLELHDGRIYIGSASVLYWTEALRPGGFKHTNSVVLPSNITLLASTNAGLIVAADRTYLMPGGDPRAMGLNEVLPYGAFRNSLLRDVRRERMYWLSTHGLCEATYDGQIRNLSEGRIVFRGGGKAAMLLREQNGIRQIIGSIEGGEPDPLVHEEFTQAEGV